MIASPDRTLLREVSDAIAKRMGLYFSEDRWLDLARGLQSASEELGFAYPDACLGWLRSGELTTRQIETLASHLTVGETYFFRDPASFELLEQKILPMLIAKHSEAGRTLRLWSAGCCTGEEAYSLAIACTRALPDLQAWNVSILATDINPKFLAKAEGGVYSEWSFRGTPGWFRERYFSLKQEKAFSIDPALKALVHFDYLNLAEDAYPALHNHTNAMDVIFCRNVLMYFTPDHQQRVVAGLHRCLVEGGCLLVNPVEASTTLFPMFSLEHIDGVVLYRKTSPPVHDGDWPGLVTITPASALPAPDPALSRAPVRLAAVSRALPSKPIRAASQETPMLLARTYANQGRLEEALTTCREALVSERTNPAGHFLYATICQELGRTEEAIVELGKVLYLDQDSILAHHALGGLYRQLGKQKESRRHLAIALKLLLPKAREEILPESDGMTCGRLMESIRARTGV